MMTEDMIFDTLRQGLWIAVMISAPLLTVALVAGVLVGLFQALTSVQEMTLTFVPKVGAMLAVFWLSMSFMTSALVSFFHDQIIPLIAGG
jgi:flagellar biosynthesis protein FliQ